MKLVRKQIVVRVLLAILTVSGAGVAQVGTVGTSSGTGSEQSKAATSVAFGLPLAGLTADEAAQFEDGLAEFENVETPEGGLGPIFNGRSCVECHSVPTAGGASNITVTRFGHSTNGVFDPMDALGGSLLQRFSIDPDAYLEVVPARANVIAQRQSTPLFGLGLVEAIPDSTIIAKAAEKKPDGVRGRVAWITDVVNGKKVVGKFGWKAQHSSLLVFAGDAYNNEMGITNRFFPTENAPNGNRSVLPVVVGAPTLEDNVGADGRSDIDAAADFIRFLAAPPRLAMSTSAQAGETLFSKVGCAYCHTPTLTTGQSSSVALTKKAVNLYSDLLLHDMGRLNDGIAQAGAATNEMKTPPLWGLRVTAPYLHDGRAQTIDKAIRLHDGEARIVRDRYNNLTPELRQQLLDFLNTL